MRIKFAFDLHVGVIKILSCGRFQRKSNATLYLPRLRNAVIVLIKQIMRAPMIVDKINTCEYSYCETR